MTLESSINSLIISSEKGDCAAIKELIESGINVDGRPEDDHMQRAGYADAVRSLRFSLISVHDDFFMCYAGKHGTHSSRNKLYVWEERSC
jgi:hypothetical protein